MGFVLEWQPKTGAKCSKDAGQKGVIVSAPSADSKTVTTRHFPKCETLRRPVEFRRVFDHGAKSADRYFVMLTATNDETKPRLGLAISKKAVGGTNVRRNRIRRVVRESFRLHQHFLPGVDVVIMARAAIKNATTDELQQSLKKHWQSILRLCEPSSLH